MCYRELPIRRLPNRKPVTELGDYQTFCGLNPPADAMAIPVPVMTVLELKERLDQEQAPVLVDVRDPNEWEIVNIPGAILMPKSPTVAAEILAAFGPNADLVISCRSGARSRTVCEELIKLNASKVRNLEGGVLAWVEQVAPELASY